MSRSAASAAKVATAISTSLPPKAGIRVGIVSSVDSRTSITVLISGVNHSFSYLSSYAPQVGDNVQLLKMNDAWVAVGTVINGHHGWIGEDGAVALSFTTLASFTQAVTFDFPFTNTPRVMVDIRSGSAVTQKWSAHVFSVGTAGFSIWVYSGDGTTATWPSIPVDWVAFEPQI